MPQGRRAHRACSQKLSGRSPLTLVLLSGLCIASVPGCDLAQGLTEVGSSLANPDAALLDRPGRKLASGAYRGLLVDGSLSDGGHVIAVRSDRGEDEVAILPYLEGSGCYVTPGVGVERVSSKIDVELSGIVAVQRDRDDSGRGEVSFVDFDCDPVFESLTDTTLPQIVFPAGNPRGVLALTTEGTLYLIDAKNRVVLPVAEDVSAARTSADSLWTIEGGELVARDGNLDEFARTGSGVTQFVIAGGSAITAAYQDESGLNVWNQVDDATTISATGCGLTPWGPDAVAYSDPCEEGQINVYTLGSRIGAVDSEYVHLVGPTGVVFAERALPYWGQGAMHTEVLLMARTESAVSHKLIVARIPRDPEAVDGVYNMEVEVLAEENGTIRGGQLYTNWNGESGTLVEQERDDENRTIGLREVARGVAQLPGATPYSAAGVLTDFEDGTGTLRVFSKVDDEIESEVIAEGVPIQFQAVETTSGRRAFVGESEDGATGTLFITDEPTVPYSSAPRVQAVAENVFKETARFLDQPRALAYLERVPDRDYAVLRVWLIESELTLTVHNRVSEYRTVPWPAPGILYAVPTGDDRGLWFSKAR